jgi:hypothetical protein
MDEGEAKDTAQELTQEMAKLSPTSPGLPQF